MPVLENTVKQKKSRISTREIPQTVSGEFQKKRTQDLIALKKG